MEETKVPTDVMIKSSATNGAILGLIGVLFMVVTYLTGDIYKGSSWITWLSMAVSVACLVYFSLKYRNTVCEGYITYGGAFMYGWLTFIFSGVIAVAFMILLQTVIEPDYMEKMADVQREILAEKGMNDSQIEQALAFGSKFQTPLFIAIFGFIGNALVGLVISLITAIFAKRNRPVFE